MSFRKLKQQLIIIAAITVVLSGCNLPLPDRNLQEYVSEEDVIGVWAMTPAPLSLILNHGFQRQETHKFRMEFTDDGTCRFQTILEHGFEIVYEDVDGEWILEHDTSRGGRDVKNKLKLKLALPDGVRVKSYGFAKKGGKIILWDYLGDPDSWKFIEYVRVQM